jgi:hypothetical protein
MRRAILQDRHCEEQSDEAIQGHAGSLSLALDCFAPLAMTVLLFAPHNHSSYPARMRGNQYAAPSRFHHRRLWNTGSSAFADDDERR